MGNHGINRNTNITSTELKTEKDSQHSMTPVSNQIKYINYYLNETLLGVIDDFYNMIELDILACYHVFHTEEKESSFFELGYLMQILDYGRYFNMISQVLSSGEIKRFFTEWNYVLRSDNIVDLREDEPFKYMFKGNICYVPKGYEQEMVAVRKVQDMLMKKFVRTLQDLDKDKVTFGSSKVIKIFYDENMQMKSLKVMVGDFYRKVKHKVRALFSSNKALGYQETKALFNRLSTCNKEELLKLKGNLPQPGKVEEQYSLNVLKFLIFSDEIETLKKYEPMCQVVVYVPENEIHEKGIIKEAQKLLEDRVAKTFRKRLQKLSNI